MIVGTFLQVQLEYNCILKISVLGGVEVTEKLEKVLCTGINILAMR